MKRKFIIAASICILIYFLSYVWFRKTHVEVWEKDGNAYVIFPQDKTYLYYLYRPLTYADGALLKMRFHIGQHK